MCPPLLKAYSLESKTGWVDFFAAPFKNRDGTRIALVLPQPQNDGDEYRHLCIISTSSSSNKPEAITRGKYVVTAILHWDTKNDILFYTANSEKNPEQLHVYAIKAATGQTPKCLTCNLHTSNGKCGPLLRYDLRQLAYLISFFFFSLNRHRTNLLHS